MMRAIFQGIGVKEEIPAEVSTWSRFFLAFQIHDKMDVKHLKVKFKKEGDFKITIGVA
jgi:hypothetical protein